MAAHPGADWITIAQAAACYVGVVLYGGFLSVGGRRPGLSGFIPFFYAGLFPLPAHTPAFLIQQVLLGITLATFGAHVLLLNLQNLREVRAAEAGRPGPAVRPGRTLGLAIVVGVLTSSAMTTLFSAQVSPGMVRPAIDRGEYVAVMLLVAVYMGAAWIVGRSWVAKVADVRLLAPVALLIRLNLVLALGGVAMAVVFSVTDLRSTAARIWTVASLGLGLLPATIVLPPVADAVTRRLITLHVMIAVVAGLMFAVPPAFGMVGLGPEPAWAVTAVLLAVLATVFPVRIDEAVARWFFPRAARMRARLTEIAEAPLAVTTRREAATRLLSRVVDALDGEGGMLVLAATAAEPACVSTCGRAHPAALGATAEQALAWLAPRVGTGPSRVDLMPLAERLRLLRAEMLLICPLSAGRLEGVLLLGERRGWAYDADAVEALSSFASRTGLALANMTLVAERLRSDKLAALGGAAARIAHEIRNPLAGARSLVQQAGAMDGAAPLVQPALEELDRIGRLVRDLLAFARVDDRRSSDTVDLEEVCRHACVQLAGVAAASGVTLATELATTPVLGDRDRLVQVVANLARNGIEAAAGSAGRRVTVRTCGDGTVATIDVCDTGPGIAAEELPRLFEPFRTSKPEGTGLGLTIARRIVEAHGGRLAVTAGEETVFRVELPLAAPAARSGRAASA